jgi:Phage integrase family
VQPDAARDHRAQAEQGRQLNTLDPMTTPAPSRCCPLAIALTAAVTSGASAASAATIPSRASDRPSRSPTRSSRDTSSQPVARLTSAPAANAATAIPTVIRADPLVAGGRSARTQRRRHVCPPEHDGPCTAAARLRRPAGSSAHAPGSRTGAERPGDLISQADGDKTCLQAGYLAHRSGISRARGPLFLSESRRNYAQPLTLWTWSKVVRQIALAAGVPQFSTHTLRHLCLTDLARMGWEVHAIAAFAGHRHTDSTLTYIHLSGRDLAAKLSSGMDHIHAWRVRMLVTAGELAEVAR